MKKTLLFQVGLYLLGNIAHAQTSPTTSGTPVPPPPPLPYTVPIGSSIIPYDPELDDKTFRKILNKEFSKILNPKSTSAIGNFLALDTKEASVAAASTFNLNKGFLVVKASGSTMDGLLPLVTNTKLNTGVELSGQFNWIASGANRYERLQTIHPGNEKIFFDADAINTLTYTDKSKKEYDKLLLEATNKQQQSAYNYTNKIDESLLLLKRTQLNNRKTKLNTTIATINGLITTNISAASAATLRQRKDSLNFELYKNEQLIAENNTAIAIYPKARINTMGEANNAFFAAQESAYNNIVVAGVRISWFSVGYSLKRSAFRLVDPTRFYAEQITKGTFTGHTFRFQYSRYNYTKERNKTYFWTVGLAPALTDNLSDLSKKEIIEESSLDTASNRRSVTEKYIAYQGVYKKDRYALSLFAEYYRFFGRTNQFAIHFFPEHRIRENKLPTTNMGVGLLFALQDQKDTKTRANIEVYANALNVLAIGTTQINFLKRSSAGIRFTFPIAFR